MADAYNKQLSLSESKKANFIAEYYGVNTKGIGTNLTLGRAARAAGVDTEGRTQDDVFEDLRIQYTSDQSRKNLQCVVDNLTPSPINTTSLRRSTKDTTSDISISPTSSNLSRQFFIWEKGVAGRMTVPIDFDFKPI